MKVFRVGAGVMLEYGGPRVALAEMTRLLSKHGIETTLMTANVDPAEWVDAS